MKINLKVRSYVTSLVLHGLFLFLIGISVSSNGSNKEKKKTNKGKSQPIEIVDRPEKSEGIIAKLKKGKGAKKKTNSDKCKDYYGGIGVLISLFPDEYGYVKILSAHPGYPAARAGLKRGDLIREVSGKLVTRLKGKAGTKIVLSVIRDNKTFTVSMIREKICTKNILESE